MGVWADDDSTEPLGEIPKSGNGLWILCCQCWVQRWVGGQEICEKWPRWLLQPGTRWASALRCDACSGRRVALMCEFDPGGSGFVASTQDTAPIIAARRLAAWLKDGPVSVYDVAPHLFHMPSAEVMREAGL